MDSYWCPDPRRLFTHVRRMSRNSETVLNEIWDAFKLLLNKPLAVKRTRPMLISIIKHKSFPVDLSQIQHLNYWRWAKIKEHFHSGSDSSVSWSVLHYYCYSEQWQHWIVNWEMERVQAEIELVIFFSLRFTQKCFPPHWPVSLGFLSLRSSSHVVIRPTKRPRFTGGLS